MSQHDYVLANQSGASFRSDMNNALAAILSMNASTVAPTTTAQGMSWFDTSALTSNVRNSADSAFIKTFKFTASTAMPYIVTSAGTPAIGSAIVQRTVNNVFSKAQRGNVLPVAYASTITLDMNGSNNYRVSTLAGNLTVANPSAITAAPGQGGSIWFEQDGTGSRTISFGSMFKFAGGTAPTATTTASAWDRADYKVRNASTIDTVFTADVK
jgi:hypothetical protein